MKDIFGIAVAALCLYAGLAALFVFPPIGIAIIGYGLYLKYYGKDADSKEPEMEANSN